MRKILAADSRLLNKPGFNSVAAVSGVILQWANGNEDDQDLVPYGELVISDCHKVVNLLLDYESVDSQENTLHKLTQLRGVIETMIGKHNEVCAISNQILTKKK